MHKVIALIYLICTLHISTVIMVLSGILTKAVVL